MGFPQHVSTIYRRDVTSDDENITTAPDSRGRENGGVSARKQRVFVVNEDSDVEFTLR